jgi:predicted transcriptional regulator
MRNTTSQPFSIRLELEQRRQLEAIAKAERRSLANLIAVAIEEFLRRQPQRTAGQEQN